MLKISDWMVHADPKPHSGTSFSFPKPSKELKQIKIAKF